MVWIRKSNIGNGRLTWGRGPRGEVGYELLVGSDPARAPRRINRWGYLREESGAAGAVVFGIMSQSDEQSIDDAERSTREGGRSRVFKALRQVVTGSEVRLTVFEVPASPDLTYAGLDTLLVAVPAGPAKTRTVTTAGWNSPGFLAAAASLIEREWSSRGFSASAVKPRGSWKNTRNDPGGRTGVQFRRDRAGRRRGRDAVKWCRDCGRAPPRSARRVSRAPSAVALHARLRSESSGGHHEDSVLMSARPTRVVPWVALVVAALILSAAAVSTAPTVLFRLEDHRDDDHGDGSLRYPLRDDLKPGELDLLSFAAHQERDGTTFEATFARPIRRPDRRVIDAGGATLDSMAKLGFYTFNIDVYIDMDRRHSSGRAALLPGRLAEAEPGSAWERVVCLTPRPHVAKSQLARIETGAAERALRASMPRVDDHEVDALKSTIKGQINARVFFPTRVSVVGPSVRFFVPASFLGGTARDSWGYIVVVSGAELELKLNLGAIFGFRERPARLMILPIASGLRRESFAGGRQDDPLQPPLVDIIVAPGTRQEDVLKDYDIRTERPVLLTAVVPAER